MMIFIAVFILTPQKNSIEQLHLAVASNFAYTVKQLNVVFIKQYPKKIQIILSTASTGKLTTQIRNGAPYDIFLAANKSHPVRLINEDLAYQQSLMKYATGQLALVAHQSTGNSVFVNLQSGNIEQLALANPKTSPYGNATLLWLTAQGLSKNQFSILTAENITQSWQFFESGGADAAFVSLAQILQAEHQYPYWLVQADEPNQQLSKIPYTFDQQAIDQFAVILKSTHHLILAQSYLKFLGTDQAKSIIKQSGYRLNP